MDEDNGEHARQIRPRRPIEIRRACPSDAETIAAVLGAAFVEYKALYTEAGYAATVLSPAQVIERMAEGPVWISLQNGTIAATVAAVVKEKSVYIRGMAAIPAARRSGIGTALLHCVEDWAKAQGFYRLFLSTTPFLASAIQLYEEYGFRRIDESFSDLFGTPLFIMEKMWSAHSGN